MIDWKKIEEKWQKRWDEAKVFETDPDPDKSKYYLTVAYPYPNSPQHIGHGRTYTLTDVHARYWRMRGKNVLFPMAWHYTGTPLFAMVERLKDKDPEILETFLNVYNIPEKTLTKLTDPIAMATFFAKEIKHGMQKIGYSIDWRREFSTVDKYYNKFIEWQFSKLRDKGYVTQGSHPVGWCPSCGNPVGQHDTVGDKEPEIEEFTVIKFIKGDQIFPAGTLRPETVYGVTNMWLNPDIMYVEIIIDGENWIVSADAVSKLQLLGHDIKVVSEFLGTRLIGAKLINPVTRDEIPILPATFVDPKTLTGLVMSVPAHAPFDYIALKQLKNDVRKNPDKYKIKASDVRDLKPISVIEVDGYGESPAVDVCEKMGITYQEDDKLEKATKQVYSAEFHGGKMRQNTGVYSSLPVQQAKEAVKKDMISNGTATTMFEMLEPVQCRCGSEVVVKIFENQWFINYGDFYWKKLAHENIDNMKIIPIELRQEFKNVIDWLKAKACARKAGLGTKLPWASDWIIEALSDSVIYMAYYLVVKGIKEINPDADSLGINFWDYVFLGLGSVSDVASSSGFSEEKLLEIRNEFLYFYPMDARHSGRDLISNHLTYMIFCHDGIWAREMWPKGIVVNGSVLMEGSKMSKSLNNIIPLINAVEMYGADPLRLSLMITAEPLKDADFSPGLAKNMRDNLDSFHTKAKRIIKEGKGNSSNLFEIDKWMLSRLQTYIKDANSAMKELRVRKAIHAALYDLNQDLEWYLRRINKDREKIERIESIKYLEWMVLDTQIRLLTPFTPHLCEEIWEAMNGKGFIAFAEWPKVNKNLIRLESEELERIIQNSVEDIKNIIKVTGITPTKIHFYTADGWKWKIYLQALELSKKDMLDVGTLIKKAFRDDEMKVRSKLVPRFARGVVEDVIRLPDDALDQRLKLKHLNEVNVLQDSIAFLEKEFNCEINVSMESDPWINDPAKRAYRSKPYKPAIFVE